MTRSWDIVASVVVFFFCCCCCVQQVWTLPCTNLLGDAYCLNKLNQADYCTLDKDERCGCAKDCRAPTDCNDPDNHDLSCDCPFNAVMCDQTWMITSCNYTCTLRDTVTCPTPTLTVPNASLRYNGDVVVPSYGPAKFMDEATYDCDPGYVNTSGTSKPYRRLCGRSGSWVLDPSHQRQIVCQPIHCGPPPTIPLTTPSQAIGSFDDQVTYQCDPDHAYQLLGGAGEKRCAENASWVDEGFTAPLCLGLAVRFVGSQEEMTATPQDTMTSHMTRSKLECASHCAHLVDCYGYTFDVDSKMCEMNMEQADQVITTMKRVF
ncbi:uncharacterized protein [Littorina saxatilis]|uniref:Sushi domain-containing protein n=1 Tax=Littorina saxatilis TaxID=31220 RepID=A0AAN9B3B8_9CAEN